MGREGVLGGGVGNEPVPSLLYKRLAYSFGDVVLTQEEEWG